MTEPSILETPTGRRIAYHRTDGTETGVVFLGGFMSDMTGTKAVHLEAWAKATGRAFLRLDYSGHGASSGAFTDGCIGDWAADAEAAITALTDGPQIIVGSSMGGWIALILAKRIPERFAGLVGIAAAPDFTEDSMWAGFSPKDRATLDADGHIALASEYSDAPYIITRRLIEDGRTHLVLRSRLHLPFPVRLLHGTADEDVPLAVAHRLLAHATSPDMQLHIVKNADHRFSDPARLSQIIAAVEEVGAPA